MRGVDQTPSDFGGACRGGAPCRPSHDVAKTDHPTVQGSHNNHTFSDANKHHSYLDSSHISKICDGSTVSVCRASSLCSGVLASQDSKSRRSTESTSSSSSSSSSPDNFGSVEDNEDLIETDVDSEDETVMVSNKEKESRHHDKDSHHEMTQHVSSMCHSTYSTSDGNELMTKNRNNAECQMDRIVSSARAIVASRRSSCRNINVQVKPRKVKVAVARRVESDDGSTQQPLKPTRGNYKMLTPPRQNENVRLGRVANKSSSKLKKLPPPPPPRISDLDKATMHKVFLWQKAKSIINMQPREQQAIVHHKRFSLMGTFDAKGAPTIAHDQGDAATSCNDVQVKQQQVEQKEQEIVVHNEKPARQPLGTVPKVLLRQKAKRIVQELKKQPIREQMDLKRQKNLSQTVTSDAKQASAITSPAQQLDKVMSHSVRSKCNEQEVKQRQQQQQQQVEQQVQGIAAHNEKQMGQQLLQVKRIPVRRIAFERICI